MDALPRSEKILRAQPFLLLWLAGVVLCVESNEYRGLTDGPVGVPIAVALYSVMPLLTMETIVLYCIIRPNSYRWSWGRALAALGVMGPWSLFCYGLAGWQPGDRWAGWDFGHGYWLICVVVLLIALFAVSLIGASRAANLRSRSGLS